MGKFRDDDDVSCRLCGQIAEWCFGCRSFICDDHVAFPAGRHQPEDHDGLPDE